MCRAGGDEGGWLGRGGGAGCGTGWACGGEGLGGLGTSWGGTVQVIAGQKRTSLYIDTGFASQMSCLPII